MHLTYYSESELPEVEYIFNFLFNAIGIKGDRVNGSKPQKIDIYYGNNFHDIKYKIRIKESGKNIKNFVATDVISINNLKNKLIIEKDKSTVSFDIIRAIQFFLVDHCNSSKLKADIHGRLRAVDSYQYENYILQFPIINSYVLFFKDFIETKIGIKGHPLWPKSKECAIALTHDVDAPEMPSLKLKLFSTLKLMVKNIKRKRLKKTIGFLYDYLYYAIHFPFSNQNFWLFKEIMDEESKYGFKSTFFFSAVNCSSNYSSPFFDSCYDIREKKYRQIFEQIKNRDFEIGLHASYNAFKNLKHFQNEKNILEKIVRTKVIGLRHHFWHLGPDVEKILFFHEKTGFSYDSSIAFNDLMGFRRSVALPYNPWCCRNKRAISTMQIPTFLMDGNLFYKQIEPNDAIEIIMNQIKKIKKLKGVGAIDWHVRTSLPMNDLFRNWGITYKKVLKLLSEDKSIWVTNLSDIYRFAENRKNLINN